MQDLTDIREDVMCFLMDEANDPVICDYLASQCDWNDLISVLADIRTAALVHDINTGYKVFGLEFDESTCISTRSECIIYIHFVVPSTGLLSVMYTDYIHVIINYDSVCMSRLTFSKLQNCREPQQMISQMLFMLMSSKLACRPRC